MIDLQVDHTYRFQFTHGFESLGSTIHNPTAGVYQLRGIYNYDEILLQQVDLVKDLYEVVGKTEGDFTTDEPTFPGTTFYKIQDNQDLLKVYHVPSSFVIVHPSVHVYPYGKLALSVDLGVVAEPTLIDTITEAVGDIVAANLGITTPPRLVVYNREWLTDEDYKVIKDNREAAKGTVINYYKEYNRLIADNTQLQSRVVALEAILASL